MEIKEHQLQSFIGLYEQEFGILLTRSEAHEKASALLHYTRLFIQSLAEIREDDINNVSNASE
jgi:hypothetical protein